jgi:hypothetical protein
VESIYTHFKIVVIHWCKDQSWLSRFYCHSWEIIAFEYHGA